MTELSCANWDALVGEVGRSGQYTNSTWSCIGSMYVGAAKQESISIGLNILSEGNGWGSVVIVISEEMLRPRQESNLQQEFSFAYVRAVASHAGYLVRRPDVDVNSVDLQIVSDHLIVRESVTRPVIDVQVKSDTRHEFSNDELSHELPVKNYNDLRGTADPRMRPHILIVVLMPRSREDWLTQTEQELIARKCAYWCNLQGCPPRDNASTVTVRVKRRNIFDAANLTTLMARESKGVQIGYEI